MILLASYCTIEHFVYRRKKWEVIWFEAKKGEKKVKKEKNVEFSGKKNSENFSIKNFIFFINLIFDK